MQMKSFVFILTLLCLLASACSPQATPEATLIPTNTSFPTSTPSPSSTPTSTKTPTPSLTSTPTQFVPAALGTEIPQLTNVINRDNVENLVEVARWGDGTNNGVIFSPDGKILAVRRSNSLSIYDADAAQEIRRIEIPNHAPTGDWRRVYDHMSFSPDGRIFAALGDGKVWIYKVSDWSWLKTIDANGARMLAFSPDGTRILTLNDHDARLWDLADGRSVKMVEAGFIGAAFTPEGTPIVADLDWETGNKVSISNVDTGEIQRIIELDTKFYYRGRLSQDGRYLAIWGGLGTGNPVIYIWRVDDGSLVKRIITSDSIMLTMPAFSNDGNYMAIQAQSNQIQIFRDNQFLRALNLNFSENSSLALSPDGSRLAIAAPSQVEWYETQNGKLLGTINDWTAGYAAFSPQGDSVAVSNESQINVLDLKNGDRRQSFDFPTESLPGSIKISPNGRFLAAIFYKANERHFVIGSTLEWWRLEDGKPLKLLEKNGSTTFSGEISFTSDGRLIILSDNRGNSYAYVLESGSPVKIPSAGESPVMSPDGKTIIALGSGISIVDISTGSLVRNIVNPELDRRITTFSLSPSGEIIAAGTENVDDEAKIYVWRVADGTLLQTLSGHSRYIFGLDFSADGSLLASTGSGEGTFIWDVGTGELLTKFPDVRQFSPDGIYMIGGNDGAIHWWGVPNQ